MRAEAYARSTDPRTSWEAAESLTEDTVRASQRLVLNYIRGVGRAYIKEVEDALHIPNTKGRSYARLRSAGDKIMTCVHLIFGLPGETPDMMLESVRKVAELRPNQVKIHLLHVIEGTKLAQIYKAGEYTPMDRDAYIETVCRALRLLPPETVIGRLTGDGAPDTLLAPQWSRRKTTVINDIDKMMVDLGWVQGDQI